MVCNYAFVLAIFTGFLYNTHKNKQYKMDNTNFLISVERVTHKNISRMPQRHFWESRFMCLQLREL
jgi:hypothetical protein